MPQLSEHEIDEALAAALRRGGIALEPDRLAVMRESFVRYLDLVRVLDEPQSYAQEPAVTLRLQPTTVRP